MLHRAPSCIVYIKPRNLKAVMNEWKNMVNIIKIKKYIRRIKKNIMKNVQWILL